MKKLKHNMIIAVLLSFAFINGVYSQDSIKDLSYHPYRVNYWITGPILGAGLAANYFGISRVLNKDNLSLTEIQQLNEGDINGFDKWALNLNTWNASVFADYSDYTLMASIAMPVLLLFDKSIKKDWLDVLLIYLETMSLTTNIYEWSFLGPSFQNRIRPVAYYGELPYDDRKSGNNRNSFYSGHVASVTASTFFMAKVYSDYHPEIGNNKYFLYGAALVPPLVLGYLRIKALKHFPTDIAVGMGIGILCGIIVPELHRTSDKTFTVELNSAYEGAVLAIKWQPGFLK